MALKCRGMGKAMKRRFAEGGKVEGPNTAQRAFGSTIFQRAERKRMEAAELAAAGDMTPQTAPAPAPAPEPQRQKPRVVDASAKARQDAQLRALRAKQDAEAARMKKEDAGRD
jgi:hypothetical protein